MSRIRRILIIIFITAGGIGLGLLVGPQPRTVQAEFYIDLLKALELPSFSRGAVNNSGVRRFRFNGEQVFYSVHETTESVEALLKFHLEHLQQRQVDKSSNLLRHYGNIQLTPEQQDTARDWAPLLSQTVGDNVYTMHNEDWGYLFALTKNLSEKDPLQNLVVRWKRFVKTGDIGELGSANVVLAYRDKIARSTHYLKFWTAQDFNLYNVLGRDGNEAPGREIPEVPRLADATRFVSIEELSEGQAALTNAYRVMGDVGVLSDEMAARLSQAGWQRIVPAGVVTNPANRSVLYFEKGESLLTLSFLGATDETFYIVARKS